jgi:hypothetical protein
MHAASAAMSLEYVPGSAHVYSDFGMILLAFIIEQAQRLAAGRVPPRSHLRAARHARHRLQPARLAVRHVLASRVATTAPTRRRTRSAASNASRRPRSIPCFRMRHIRGEVHDENAFARRRRRPRRPVLLRPRPGRFAQMLLDGGFYGGVRYIDPATVALFTRRHDLASSRGLGWDTPSNPASSAGDVVLPHVLRPHRLHRAQHLDRPGARAVPRLLMNRVNPTRDNQRHVPLRRPVADAVQLAVTDSPCAGRTDVPPTRGDRHAARPGA